MESESAQNLFSKAQVHEVIKGLNVSANSLYPLQIREGLFTEDDMKLLEGGYSISDTEDEISAMNDLLSAHSYYQSKVPGFRNPSGAAEGALGSMAAASPLIEDLDLD